MSGLSAERIRELTDLFKQSGYFETDRKLRTLFVDSRIAPWQDRIPQVQEVKERIEQVISGFAEIFSQDGYGVLELIEIVVKEKAPESPARSINKAEELLGRIRSSLRLGKARRSRRLFNQLKKEYPDNPNLNCLDLLSKVISLMDFSKSISRSNMPDCNKDWAAECICAYVAARGKLRHSGRRDKQQIANALNNMRYRLPVDKVDKDELCLDKLADLENDPDQIVPSRPRVWPLPSVWDGEQSDGGEYEAFPLKALAYNSVFNKRKEQRAFFWGGHKVFRDLLEQQPASTRPDWMFIYGESGCGRTAFAKALRFYAASDRLVLSMPEPSFNHNLVAAIQKQATLELWKFIEAHPTYLARLHRAQRNLLCQVLLYEAGSAIRLETDIRNMQAGLNGLEEWVRQGKAQLSLFADLVHECAASKPICDLGDTVRCAKALGFSQVTLVVDADDVRSIEQIQNDLFQLDMSMVVFLPTEVWNNLSPQYKRGRIRQKNLFWEKKDLQNMLEERFAAAAGIRDNLFNYFETPEVLEELIGQSHGNPGRLIRNLRQIVNGMNIPAETVVTFDHLRRLAS